MRGKKAKQLRRQATSRQEYQQIKRHTGAIKQLTAKLLTSPGAKPKRRKPLPVAKTAFPKPAHLVRENLKALREAGHEMPGYRWRNIRAGMLNWSRHHLVSNLKHVKENEPIRAD